MLYRVFPLEAGAALQEEGGPLHVARALQGGGRHDNPGRFGILYASRSPESVVAEQIRRFRARRITPAHFRREGRPMALAAIDDGSLEPLLDLDDPRNLAARDLRPSGVATGKRRATRRMAVQLYEEGPAGFEWWSTIEASWINVTLFADRALERLRLAADPEPLTLDHGAVRAAADVVGVELGS
ncbi:MAG: RES family NAD+ phosphorylase [Actinomycetota bacterium]